MESGQNAQEERIAQIQKINRSLSSLGYLKWVIQKIGEDTINHDHILEAASIHLDSEMEILMDDLREIV